MSTKLRKETIESIIVSANHEIQSEFHEIRSELHEIRSELHEDRVDPDHGEEEGNAKIDDGKENREAKISTTGLPGEEGDGKEEGFTTPTSTDHKIPAITKCPPPPGKARPQYSTLKRRAPPEFSRRLLFFTTAEIESVLLSPIKVEEKTLKKARTTTE